MEQQSLSSVEANSAPKLVQGNRSTPLFPVMARPLLTMPRQPLFPMSSSAGWPMMVAANLNWMLAFHQRQNLFARPMLSSSHQSCSSGHPPQALTQIPCMAKSLTGSITAHTNRKIPGKKLRLYPPNDPPHSHLDGVAIKPVDCKDQFSVYSVCPTAHNNSENKIRNELCQPTSSSAVSFQAVLYNGEEELISGQIIVIPSDLLEKCHKSSSPSEANYCASTAVVLRRIRKGEEVVVLHDLQTVDAKIAEKDVKNKNLPKVFSTNHLVRNLLKPSKKYRRETTSPNVSSAPHAQRPIQTQKKVGEAINNKITKEDEDHEKLPGYQCERCRKMFSYAYYSLEKMDKSELKKFVIEQQSTINQQQLQLASLIKSTETLTATNQKLSTANSKLLEKNAVLHDRIEELITKTTTLEKTGYGQPPVAFDITQNLITALREADQMKGKSLRAVIERAPEGATDLETKEKDKNLVDTIIKATGKELEVDLEKVHRHGDKKANRSRIIKVQFTSEKDRNTFLYNFGKATRSLPTGSPRMTVRRDMTANTRCVDNGDRKFPCPLCSRSFEKRDRLRIHVLHVHENHRPHVCSVCGKAFSQSSSLNKHLRVHSGERPYHCPHCTKSFTASSILRTHIRQHSGEKPFKCAFCGKSFASHAAHDSHVRRTHSAQT